MFQRLEKYNFKNLIISFYDFVSIKVSRNNCKSLDELKALKFPFQDVKSLLKSKGFRSLNALRSLRSLPRPSKSEYNEDLAPND